MHAAEPVTLKVFSLPTKQGGSPEYRVVERFRELHPEINLVSSTALSVEGMTLDAAPLMAIAGGTSPDIIYVNFRQSDTYISQGFLYPLDEFIAKMSPEELAERVPASVMPVVHREGPGGVHYWAMPQEVLATVLMYRRDLFAAAGLDPEKPPRDWAELRQFAAKVADPSKGIYGLAFGEGPEASYCMYTYLCSAGAEAVKRLPDGQWRAAFDSEEAVTAYAFVDELQKAKVTKGGVEGQLAYRGTDLYQKWDDGRVAMAFLDLQTGVLTSFNPDLVGVGPIPKGPTGKASAAINSRMLGIFAGQKDPKVRAAAWEYIHFLDSPEAHRIYTQTMVEQGMGRMLSPTWLRKFGYEELAKLCPPGLEEAFETAKSQGTPEPYGRNCQFVYTMMTQPMDKIYRETWGGEKEKRARIQAILRSAVAETNEKMLGVVPPQERSKRDMVGWIVAAAVAASFVLLLRKVFAWMNVGRPGPAEGVTSYRIRLAGTLLAPSLILILMWQYYPLLRGSLMAFQKYNVMGGSPWVGISNFADVIYDSGFWMSLWRAAYFCALWMVIGFLPPMFLAVMLQEIPWGKVTYRVLFYLPAVVSSLVVLFMWRQIYDPSPDGILNRILAFFQIGHRTWLGDPHLAMLCIVFPMAWAALGPGSIIYLAALKGIPDELYEAADIDGAGFLDKLRYIVFPYLRPLIVINVVGALISGFNSGGAVLAMTGGGPDKATHVVGYEIFQQTFMFMRFGHGTAMAWILGVLLLSFTAWQLKILNQVEFRTANR